MTSKYSVVMTSSYTQKESLITDADRIKFAFGRVVTSRRIKAGIEQREFSRMTGISNSHLRKIESGQTSPTLITIIKIAQALNIEAEDLVCEACIALADKNFEIHPKY